MKRPLKDTQITTITATLTSTLTVQDTPRDTKGSTTGREAGRRERNFFFFSLLFIYHHSIQPALIARTYCRGAPLGIFIPPHRGSGSIVPTPRRSLTGFFLTRSLVRPRGSPSPARLSDGLSSGRWTPGGYLGTRGSLLALGLGWRRRQWRLHPAGV